MGAMGAIAGGRSLRLFSCDKGGSKCFVPLYRLGEGEGGRGGVTFDSTCRSC